MLKGFVKDLADVPEEHRGLYKQVEGGYALEVEGMVDKSRLDEFRDNNIKLSNDLERTQEEKAALAKKYEGIDLDKIRELQEKEQKIKDQQLIDAGKANELIEIKVAEVRNQLKADMDKLAEEKETLQTSLGEAHGTIDRMKVEKVLGDVALKHGVREAALNDVFNAAHSYGFKLSDTGDVVAIGPSGEPRRSLKDPTKPLTVDEYFTDVLPEQRSYYFKDSAGGGANNDGPGGPGGRRIDASNQEALNNNIDKIASGEVQVNMGS